MLQDEIMDIKEYFQSIEYYGNALIVKVKFPAKWSVYPSSDNMVKPAEGDNLGEYFYYGDIEKGVKLEDIFNLIKETVSMNESVALKIELLKEKMNELKELFSVTSIEDLQRLKFVIEKSNKKKKRSYKRKNNNAEEKITEEKSEGEIENG